MRAVELMMKLIDIFRHIPVTLLIAVIAALILVLYLPDNHASTLAIKEFREVYRAYLGPSLLLGICLLLARFSMALDGFRRERKRVSERNEALYQLTPEEKGYLVPYVLGDLNTLYVGLNDGVMNGLIAKGITYRAANVGDPRFFPCNLQPWARSVLQVQQYLLEGYIECPSYFYNARERRWI